LLSTSNHCRTAATRVTPDSCSMGSTCCIADNPAVSIWIVHSISGSRRHRRLIPIHSAHVCFIAGTSCLTYRIVRIFDLEVPTRQTALVHPTADRLTAGFVLAYASHTKPVCGHMIWNDLNLRISNIKMWSPCTRTLSPGTFRVGYAGVDTIQDTHKYDCKHG
jgi:hypothetical protein